MIINIANSQDFGLIGQFLCKYVRPDFLAVDYTRRLEAIGNGHNLHVMRSHSSVLQFVTSLNACSPGHSLQLHSSQVRERSDGSCTIISRVSFHHIILLKPRPKEADIKFAGLVHLGVGNAVVFSGDSLQAIGPNSSELQEMINRRFAEPDEDWLVGATTLPMPVTFSSEGCLRRIDAQGRIERTDSVDAASCEQYVPIYNSNKQ